MPGGNWQNDRRIAKKDRMNLFEKIVDSENLYRAFLQARRGKAGKGTVSSLWELQQELRAKTYKPAAYTNFRIKYPKPRLITAA